MHRCSGRSLPTQPKKKCVVITKGDSGTESFIKQIKLYQSMSSHILRWNMSIFSMRHYISLSNQINSMSDDDLKEEFSNKIIILDEAHNIRYLKNIVDKSVYGSIVRMLQVCANVKIIIATATPMTDNYEQVNSLLGICNYFRDDKQLMNGIISYNPVVREKPQSTQIGTDKYIPGMPVYESEMIGHQKQIYSTKNTDEPPDDIYRELTHISLFCFEDGTHGREITETKMVKSKNKVTINAMSTRQTKEIKYTTYSIAPELSHLLLDDHLRNSSSKYSKIIDSISNSTGNIFIFIEEVKGSGLLLLASVLEQHGYELYIGEELNSIKKSKRYTMCVGSADICPNNNDRLEGFNSNLNKNGQYVRILLGSKVIGESITLKNVRHFHCLTPHWNDSTIDQAIGRVVRNGSHVALDENQREVNIYIHTAIFPDDPIKSIDIKKLLKCKEKYRDIQQTTSRMINIAVDKYCLDELSPVKISYFTNFAVIYLHNYMDYFINLLSKEFNDRNKFINVYKLSKKLHVSPIVLNEAICRIIFYNYSIHHNTKNYKKLFLRAYGNTIFTVDDPSLPYITLPDTAEPASSTKPYTIPRKIYINTESLEINAIRYMSVADKTYILEKCIAENNYKVLKQIHTLYANINNTICHILLYRNLENSYTSTNPVPKSPSLKTRTWKNNEWSNINSVVEEQVVLDKYKILINNAFDMADTQWNIYGIISAIDGDMRVRLRSIENRRKSASDQRYVRRGKNLKSIKKEDLVFILESIQSKPVNNKSSISEIVRLIDNTIIESGQYMII